MPGVPEAISSVAELLTKAFGFAVDPGGYEQLSHASRLNMIRRGIDASLEKGDLATADLLFANYRDLLRQVGP